MAAKRQRARSAVLERTGTGEGDANANLGTVVSQLKALGSEINRAGMARFGINTKRAFGVSMAALRPLERQYRRQHELAGALWASGYHEARILAAMIDDPARVTRQQMDAWVAAFDSWDVCDQVSMKLFAKTAFVHEAVAKWARDPREFVRRAAFATIAGYAISAKKTPHHELVPLFALIESQATDDRNFVRKAVNWALRQLGKRSKELHAHAVALAERLAAAPDKTARWIGKDALRELTDPRQLARLERRSQVEGLGTARTRPHTPRA